MKNLIIGFLALSFSACSIVQVVNPTTLSPTANLCVVNNPKTRSGVLQEIKASLTSNKIRFNVVDDTESKNCDLVLTYEARWSWDLAIYLAYAKIAIHQGANKKGDALYDATGGAGRFDKFIDGNEKIRELMEQLLRNKPVSEALGVFSAG